MRRKIYYLFLGFMLLSIVGCKKDDSNPASNSQAGTYYGETKNVGQGTIRSWARLDDNGITMSMGLSVKDSALKGIPDYDQVYQFVLPQQAMETAFKNIDVTWFPNGHEPDSLYGQPHFDFNFFIATSDERDQINGGKDSIPVAPELVPQNYISTYNVVPNLGVHWVDTTSNEFHGLLFDKTFVYGYYHGKMTFMGPMVTAAYLETQPNSTINIKQPQTYPKTGVSYPTKYSISYNSDTKEYIIALEGMTKK